MISHNIPPLRQYPHHSDSVPHSYRELLRRARPSPMLPLFFPFLSSESSVADLFFLVSLERSPVSFSPEIRDLFLWKLSLVLLMKFDEHGVSMLQEAIREIVPVPPLAGGSPSPVPLPKTDMKPGSSV